LEKHHKQNSGPRGGCRSEHMGSNGGPSVARESFKVESAGKRRGAKKRHNGRTVNSL